jgi:dTDP-4-amino-4,6-dideoxygalactose transaminase
MKVPFVDLKAQYLSIKKDVDMAIFNVIEETAFIGGKYVQNFEKEFAEKYQVKHCISVANGTDSLYIIMKMLGIGPGDEVITVANSWISSSETITQTGAKPVFVDIDPLYYTIDEKLISSKITSRTKAILPVHLFGQMCNMDVITELASQKNLFVIEDCAQSHFSEYDGRLAGTFGIAGSFSFYPGKNLGAYGDAGCIITNDDELAEKCRTYARHGAKVKHKHIMEGINSRLDGIQAAILSQKLPHILEWTKKRIQNAVLYTELLKNVPEIICPVVRENTLHSFHLYVVKASNRKGLVQYLTESGVETAIHYPTALPNLPAYKYQASIPNDFPISSANQEVILSLPMYAELNLDQINYIVQKIIKFYKS